MNDDLRGGSHRCGCGVGNGRRRNGAYFTKTAPGAYFPCHLLNLSCAATAPLYVGAQASHTAPTNSSSVIVLGSKTFEQKVVTGLPSVFTSNLSENVLRNHKPLADCVCTYNGTAAASL